jgi:hypothetical protein
MDYYLGTPAPPVDLGEPREEKLENPKKTSPSS